MTRPEFDESDWRDLGEAAHFFAQGWPQGGEMWTRFRTLAEKAWGHANSAGNPDPDLIAAATKPVAALVHGDSVVVGDATAYVVGCKELKIGDTEAAVSCGNYLLVLDLPADTLFQIGDTP